MENYTVKQAGAYDLEFARLSKLGDSNRSAPLEIKNLIHSWSITESMDSGHLVGEINIFDSLGIFYNFANNGLIGEEEIWIRYTDWYNVSREHKFFIYAVTDVKPINSSAQQSLNYKLHFVSKEKFYSDRVRVRRSYSNGSVAAYAESIWEEFWVKTDDEAELDFGAIFIGSTSSLQNLVVPNYTPEEAMHFLSRKAYGDEKAQNTWRFFKNRDSYYFVTHEHMFEVFKDKMEKRKEELGAEAYERMYFYQTNEADLSPKGQLNMMRAIVEIEFPDQVNTFNDIHLGGYYRSTTELDFMNRATLVTRYQYLDEYQNYNLPDRAYQDDRRNPPSQRQNRDKHTKEFVNKHFTNYKDTMVLKDYPAQEEFQGDFIRPHPYYNRSYNVKPVNFYHHEKEMTKIKVHGQNTLVAGDLILLDIRKYASASPGTEEAAIDEKRSGAYLVEKIENIFYEDMYYQVIHASKSSIRGQPEPSIAYTNTPQTLSQFIEETINTFEFFPGEIIPVPGNESGITPDITVDVPPPQAGETIQSYVERTNKAIVDSTSSLLSRAETISDEQIIEEVNKDPVTKAPEKVIINEPEGVEESIPVKNIDPVTGKEINKDIDVQYINEENGWYRKPYNTLDKDFQLPALIDGMINIASSGTDRDQVIRLDILYSRALFLVGNNSGLDSFIPQIEEAERIGSKAIREKKKQDKLQREAAAAAKAVSAGVPTLSDQDIADIQNGNDVKVYNEDTGQFEYPDNFTKIN